MSEGTIDVLTNSFGQFWLQVKSPNSLGHTVGIPFPCVLDVLNCTIIETSLKTDLNIHFDISLKLLGCYSVIIILTLQTQAGRPSYFFLRFAIDYKRGQLG